MLLILLGQETSVLDVQAIYIFSNLCVLGAHIFILSLSIHK